MGCFGNPFLQRLHRYAVEYFIRNGMGDYKECDSVKLDDYRECDSVKFANIAELI